MQLPKGGCSVLSMLGSVAAGLPVPEARASVSGGGQTGAPPWHTGEIAIAVE
jgi:hypothetical protein